MQNYCKNKQFIVIISIFILLLFGSCNLGNSKRSKVIIFHAGSLAKPLREIKIEFQKIHPEIFIQLEAAGSVACARKITDFHKSCDIIASADFRIINKMLVPEYCDSAKILASNEMVIVFNNNSKYSTEINVINWMEILLRKDVNFGRSDANHDPCGYRTLLLWKLADKFYGQDSIFNAFSVKNSVFIRPKGTDLIALLDAHAVDYIFAYKSVAIQRKLNYLELPKQINLSDISFKDYYKTAKVSIRASKSKLLTLQGEPMVYGISILRNAKNIANAKLFYDFIFSEKGKAIFIQNGQPLLKP